MSRRRQRRPNLPPQEMLITRLSHEGRGIANHEDGKVVFVDFALPGERVSVNITEQQRKYDEGDVLEVFEASSDRVAPACPHFSVCGGCSLQHMDRTAQIRFKQSVLTEQLQHFGGLQPAQWLPPLVDDNVAYRRKARLGVRYVIKKEKLLVGFRERKSGFLAEMSECHVLDARIGQSIMALRDMITTLDGREQLPQIEVAAGDPTADDPQVALIFRHFQPLTDHDRDIIREFCQQRGWHCYLQPGGYDSVHRIWPEDGENRLYYHLPEFGPNGLRMAFHPNDFTQVNAAINNRMVSLALKLLEPKANERVLDLFCGLGNFTLPLATVAAEVVGVEGSQEMVERGGENAKANGLSNVSFYAHDLTKDVSGLPWAQAGFDKILIDPPRSGALEVLPHVIKLAPSRIVYVSCNPATLARDAGELAKSGYVLTQAGVMDMFTHTTHVESIAVFERRG